MSDPLGLILTELGDLASRYWTSLQRESRNRWILVAPTAGLVAGLGGVHWKLPQGGSPRKNRSSAQSGSARDAMRQ